MPFSPDKEPFLSYARNIRRFTGDLGVARAVRFWSSGEIPEGFKWLRVLEMGFADAPVDVLVASPAVEVKRGAGVGGVGRVGGAAGKNLGSIKTANTRITEAKAAAAAAGLQVAEKTPKVGERASKSTASGRRKGAAGLRAAPRTLPPATHKTEKRRAQAALGFVESKLAPLSNSMPIPLPFSAPPTYTHSYEQIAFFDPKSPPPPLFPPSHPTAALNSGAPTLSQPQRHAILLPATARSQTFPIIGGLLPASVTSLRPGAQ